MRMPKNESWLMAIAFIPNLLLFLIAAFLFLEHAAQRERFGAVQGSGLVCTLQDDSLPPVLNISLLCFRNDGNPSGGALVHRRQFTKC